nr:TcR V13J2.2 beta chain {clone Mouse4A8, complementarity determining region 3} [mice, CBA/J, induced autoimmune thyroiditic, thyroid, Peptide Partial, 15 aa] [Mus sp.]
CASSLGQGTGQLYFG